MNATHDLSNMRDRGLRLLVVAGWAAAGVLLLLAANGSAHGWAAALFAGVSLILPTQAALR